MPSSTPPARTWSGQGANAHALAHDPAAAPGDPDCTRPPRRPITMRIGRP